MSITHSFDYQKNNFPPAFDVDGMLGGLAKWLRILGYDAVFPIVRPSHGRIFVTAIKRVPFCQTVHVTPAQPEEQLVQVLNQLRISPNPDLFLSRCLVCNALVKAADKEQIAGMVPKAIIETRSIFKQCPTCGRIYWEGFHGERIKERLKNIGIL